MKQFLLSTTVLLALASSAGASCIPMTNDYRDCRAAEDRQYAAHERSEEAKQARDRAYWEQLNNTREIERLRQAIEQQNFLLQNQR